MGPPTFVDGNVLSASDVNEWLRGPLWVRKTTDEQVVSDTELHVDTELSIDVGSNRRYFCEFFVLFRSHPTNDFKVRMDFPAGAIFRGTGYRYTTGATGSDNFRLENWTEETIANLGSFGIDVDQPFVVRGVLSVGSLAGPARVQWAQVVSGGAPATVRANSFISIRRVE